MKEYIEEFKKMPLFKGIKEEEMEPMLTCIGGKVKQYKKGSIIPLANEPVKYVGILLSGKVHMIKEDLWGSKTILAIMRQNEVFGETFACGSRPDSAVTFLAAEDTNVLYLPFRKVLHSCNLSCIFHHRLIENMVTLIADKNWQLMEKVEVTSKKTLRDKILTYLSLQAQKNGSKYFEIPLGRIELAEYLCADRSAMTRELANMKEAGLIDYEKNTFRLLR